ncbi:hypothetical protein [Shewanella nanhaiensis]|uniref:Uncharacterized protein n=1 Tax=Shewanella nanhaiensis TaxID=2864872 RepID=A0ABS7E4N2_9GAMM|nr:hypothetical protein [Shewanella nanhaiensis]MBW8184625.1 hypothetical protein [Shewanella nanhaiensis]
MLNKKVGRRSVIKSSLSITAMAAVTPNIAIGMATQSEVLKPEREASVEFIVQVLTKHTKRSKKVEQENIIEFAQEFVALNGDLNYKKEFAKANGEYRLVKLFIRSLHASLLA